MKNKELRDMMAKLYRLIEKYESIPDMTYQDECELFFSTASKECSDIYNQYDSPYARKLIVAFYDALCDLYKQKYRLPLKDRPKEPEQVKIGG